jgi:hypothetical protein
MLSYEEDEILRYVEKLGGVIMNDEEQNENPDISQLRL